MQVAEPAPVARHHSDPTATAKAVNGKAPEPAAAHTATAAGDPAQQDLESIVEAFRQAWRALRANDPANWAEGLTMPQIRVLFFLGRSGPASVGQVATGLGISQPSATETLDRLVRQGLVDRAPDACDRRVVRSVLTERGKEMIDRPWETRRAVLTTALRGVSPEERSAIAHGLELLSVALEKAASVEA